MAETRSDTFWKNTFDKNRGAISTSLYDVRVGKAQQTAAEGYRKNCIQFHLEQKKG